MEEQIRLMEEAAQSQAGHRSNGGDEGGGNGDGDPAPKSLEDLAYEAFMVEHPDWYVVLPDDASLLDKTCALPRSCWLFIVRLGENFGYGYVAAVFFTYGLNQGISGAWYEFATNYYFVDWLQVTPARFAEFMGLAHVPWDIKAGGF